MLKHRYDFVYLFDVSYGNPNGDPDTGNKPRTNGMTRTGIVTPECMKSKVRKYVDLVKRGQDGYDILMRSKRALNEEFTSAHEALKTDTKKKTDEDIRAAREFMQKKYWDVRMFGAVMSTGDNPCGTLTGPVQFNFPESVTPIRTIDVTITRQVATTVERKKGENAGSEMGSRTVIPYALYRGEGYVSSALANDTTNLSEEDIELLWDAMANMFEHDHSTARGKMCMRGLYVFEHDTVLGNYPSHLLFDKIKVEKVNPEPYANQFSDFAITVDEDMPRGVTLIRKIG